MLKYFRQGGASIRDSLFLLFPVLLFTAIGRLLDSGNPILAANAPLAPQLIHFIFSPWVFGIASASAIFDAFATLYLTADVYLAGMPGRSFRRTLHAASISEWLGYALFVFFWYALFTSFGLGIIATTDADIGIFWLKVAVIIFFAALSFPAFYGGISTGAFAIIVRRDRGVSLRSLLRRIRDRAGKVYRFYAVRAFLELGALNITPVVAALWLRGYPVLGFLLVVSVSGVALAIARAASVAFKLELVSELR